MFKPDVTLVTYTYNDAEQAGALLASLAGWQVQPRCVIVVDDGSAVPFETEWHALPVQIIRFPENKGRTEAKRAGLSAATTRFILSMDNDVRLSPEWLSICLPVAARPTVGMVSSPLGHASGESLSSRYLACTYSLQLGISGEVTFISGGVWLMRSAVWRDVGGFGNYTERFGQDARLCERVGGAGLRLELVADCEAWEVRPLPRHVIIKRGWRWQGYHFRAALDEGRPVDEVCDVFLYKMRERLARSREADILFLYYDLFYLVYALTDVLCHAALSRPEAKGHIATPFRAAMRLLEECPAVRDMLRDDLARLAVPVAELAEYADAEPGLDFASLLQPHFTPDDCAALEAAATMLRDV